MRIVAIFGIGWAVAIGAWFTGWAVGHAVVAIRDRRHARQVVKGAERFLAEQAAARRRPTIIVYHRTSPEAIVDAIRRWEAGER